MLTWVIGLAGIVLLLATTSSMMRTLIMPRATTSLISMAISQVTFGFFRLIARRSKSYPFRDSVMAWASPVTLLGMLVVWLLLYFLSYALLLDAFDSGTISFPVALREAGSSIFTLGFASTDRAQLTLLDFMAAATGPIVIGMMIGYLPTLYGSFNRREGSVTQLAPRCGEPNWGPELLARHAYLETLDQLSDLWREWERWAADVSETHSSYPILLAFRSTTPTRNWAVALLCVMDAAAMRIALVPSGLHGTSRVLLRQGIACFAGLAAMLGYRGEVGANASMTLTYEEFQEGIRRLDDAGFPSEVSAEEAWPGFSEWRRLYEGPAYFLCCQIDAVPAPWSGPRKPATEVMPAPALRRPETPGPGRLDRF